MCTGGTVSPRLPRGDHSRARFRSILLVSRLRLLSNAWLVGHAGAQASVLSCVVAGPCATAARALPLVRRPRAASERPTHRSRRALTRALEQHQQQGGWL